MKPIRCIGAASLLILIVGCEGRTSVDALAVLDDATTLVALSDGRIVQIERSADVCTVWGDIPVLTERDDNRVRQMVVGREASLWIWPKTKPSSFPFDDVLPSGSVIVSRDGGEVFELISSFEYPVFLPVPDSDPLILDGGRLWRHCDGCPISAESFSELGDPVSQGFGGAAVCGGGVFVTTVPSLPNDRTPDRDILVLSSFDGAESWEEEIEFSSATFLSPLFACEADQYLWLVTNVGEVYRLDIDAGTWAKVAELAEVPELANDATDEPLMAYSIAASDDEVFVVVFVAVDYDHYRTQIVGVRADSTVELHGTPPGEDGYELVVEGDGSLLAGGAGLWRLKDGDNWEPLCKSFFGE